MVDAAYAQTTAQAVPAQGPFGSLFLIGGFVLLFYFFFIYPQGKEKKKRDEMLSTIQRGDRVLTRGGIYGTVADIKEKLLVLKISENTKVEVDRDAIESVEKPS